MRNSEIFESFVKIAEEKGLTTRNDRQYDQKFENSWLSPKEVEKLYDVHPHAPEDMQYKRNIIEDAHPDSVILSPSYDKLNGLVENANERQDIILNIVNRNNNGQLTNHKYAQNLALNLARLANELDNKNKPELMALADSCLYNLRNKQMKKQANPAVAAAGAGTVGIIIGAVVAIGVIGYIQQHTRNFREGFEKDLMTVINELDDLINASSSVTLYGYQLSPECISHASKLKTSLQQALTKGRLVLKYIKEHEAPKTIAELKALAEDPGKAEEAKEVHAYFKEFVDFINDDLKPLVEANIENFDDEDYKERSIVDRGFLTKWVDKAQILHGGWGAISDDFDDVRHALAAFKLSMDKLYMASKRGLSSESIIKDKLTKAQSAKYEVPAYKAKPSAKKPVKPVAPTTAPPASEPDTQ